MSRKYLVFVALAGLAASTASFATAADLGGEYAPADSGSAGYDWSGTYVGIQAGVQSPSTVNPFSSRRGWTMGAQAGMNFQTGPLVYGGEVEANLSSGTDYRRGAAEFEQRSTVAAKARAGFALDRTLLYGTAGYGLTKLKSKGDVISDDQWEGGLLYGAGVEQAFGGGTSVRAEYTIHKLDGVDSITTGGVRRSDNLSSHNLKLGLNYRF